MNIVASGSRTLALFVTPALVLALGLVTATADATISPFIIGGEDVTADEDVPNWLANLRLSNGQRPFCAATLVDEGWVMTAAHCLFSNSTRNENGAVPLAPSDLELRFGERDYRETGTRVRVERYVIHSGFANGSGSFDNDIAVLKLDLEDSGLLRRGPGDLGTPVSLAAMSEVRQALDAPDEHPMTLLGWGWTEDPAPEPRETVLQRLDGHPLVQRRECRSVWGNGTITSRMLCAGTTQAVSTDEIGEACFGDSGGPLFFNDGNRDVQTGIVSFGRSPCGEALTVNGEQRRRPAVYTDVSSLREWVGNATANGGVDSMQLSFADEDAAHLELAYCETGTVHLDFRAHDQRHLFAPHVDGNGLQLVAAADIDQDHGRVALKLTASGDEAQQSTVTLFFYDNHGNLEVLDMSIDVSGSACTVTSESGSGGASGNSGGGGGGGGNLSPAWILLLLGLRAVTLWRRLGHVSATA